MVVATAVASGIGSLICGIFGNLPFGLAPGTGLSAYLTYGLVLSGYLTRSQAMTTCFLSGKCFMYCTSIYARLSNFLVIHCHSGLLMGFCALIQVSNIIMKVGKKEMRT